MDNIVKVAKQHGLTMKQEMFARSAAAGKTLVEATRDAGYLRKTDQSKPSLPYKMMKNERIQARIQEIINEGKYSELAKSHWQEVLSAEPPADWSEKDKWILRVKLWEAKDRAINAIARLGGWEPSAKSETKSLVLKGDLADILPQAK